MSLPRYRLNDDQVADHLATVPGWTVVNDKLTRTFEFQTYAAGVLFACAVAHRAEHMDHHPDLTIGWCRVTVAVNTHDVNGLSPLDFELARHVQQLAERG